MMMKKVIDIEAHSFLRILERGLNFGLDYYETKERVFKTVRLGKPAKKKHLSKKDRTYYHYFKDNLSFYVICQEKETKSHVYILIKTVIIETGRE